jgi:hypothetical protein
MKLLDLVRARMQACIKATFYVIQITRMTYFSNVRWPNFELNLSKSKYALLDTCNKFSPICKHAKRAFAFISENVTWNGTFLIIVFNSCEIYFHLKNSGVNFLPKKTCFIIRSSLNIISDDTERRGRLVNTSASYSGGPDFKSHSGDRLFRLRPFVVFLAPSGQIAV